MNYNSIPTTPAPSVYRRGAEDGWRLGLWMCAAFLTGAYSMQLPLLGILSTVMMLGVPVIVYLNLRRDFRRYPPMRFFSAVWMHGIASFFFASILLAACMFIFLRFIEPSYLVDNVKLAIQMYRSLKDVPEAAEMAHTLQQMVDKHLLPSPISISVSMIWAATFFGSVLSLILTGIIFIFNRKNVNITN